MTDEKATRYLLLADEQKSEEGAKELFSAVADSYRSDNPIFAYPIALMDSRFIGSCGRDIRGEPDFLKRLTWCSNGRSARKIQIKTWNV